MSTTLKFGNGEWATKDKSVLAYNDENNNFKPLPFDFERGSIATRVNKEGLIETVGTKEPRVDFKDDSKGAMLLEPQRTNLVLTSASGTYGNSPASETNITSPDGTNNAVIPIPDSTSDRYQYTISSNTYPTNTKLVYSWYRKRISTPIYTSFLGDLQFKILVNATQLGSTTQIESDVNGFDRFEAIFNINNGSTMTIIRSYFGEVVGVGNSSIAYWGHQLEAGSYATSYIPTQGTSQTRLRDFAQIPSVASGIINSFEGSVFYDLSSNLVTTDSDYFSIEISTQTSPNNRVQLSTFAGAWRLYLISPSGSVNNLVMGNIVANERVKIALTYSSTGLRASINGSSILVKSGTYIPTTTLDSIKFSNVFGAGAFVQGNIYDTRIYNTALTDQELIKLTKI